MATSDKKQKVLIVDDEPTNIKILSSIVDPFASVLFALSGETALPIAISEQPDLILLDIVMPGMDGYELIVALKSDPETEKIPVIFVTSKVDEDEEIKGLNLGAIDYIAKPLSAPIIAVRVKNHLELKRNRDLLEELSSIDGLTGIPNRRAFDRVLGSEWKKAMRSYQPISLIMADVDKFKVFNDSFGHLAGDIVLTSIARFLDSMAGRVSDFAARYGGEEFAIILPGLDLEQSFSFTQRIQEGLARLNVNDSEVSKYATVTLSYGIACVNPAPGDNMTQLIADADRMLYKAKASGRNRILPIVSD